MASEREERVGSGLTSVAPTYDSIIPFFETFAGRLVEVAGIREGDRVLDMACGTGRCVMASAAAVGPTGVVLGTDLVHDMAALARGTALDAGLAQVHVAVGDAEHLGVPAGAFDAVTCGFGVFFFPKPLRALAEARRALRPQGRFAATTFADGVGGYEWAVDVSRSLDRDSLLQPSPVLGHDGLESALAQVGFSSITSTPVEGRFVFPDVDAYLAWCWSTGQRHVLATLTEEELDRYRTLSAERLDAHAVEGGFEMRQPANVTVAVR